MENYKSTKVKTLSRLLKGVTIASIFILNMTTTYAQQPANNGFENWTSHAAVGSIPAYNTPDGWGTSNAIANKSGLAGVDSVTVFGAASSDVYAGTGAMKIISYKYNAGPFGDVSKWLPSGWLGFAFTGTMKSYAPCLFPGYAQTVRYTTLSFYAKYAPVGSDNGICTVFFRKRNGSSIDTVAYGAVQITGSSSYKQYNVVLNYKSTANPDTAVVFFASSGAAPKDGSTLWVDAVSFSGLNGVNEHESIMDVVKAYPNPAVDRISFNSVNSTKQINYISVFDERGVKKEEVKFNNGEAILSTSGYVLGVYFYSAYDEKKELIGRGRFAVIK